MKAVVGSGISSMSLSLIAAQPRMLEPSMPKPSSKVSSSSWRDRVGNVLLQTGQVGEAQVQLLDVMLLGVFKDVFRRLSSVAHIVHA